ncbi:MAG: glycosyl hydrolase [Kiritimatiellia bacterium]|nr:glycosyl hydrolase [Kiritimatiellia bacterium]MDP6848434.1 glycosyl hydrolase [Kiritimatiellia bacterium]
MRSILLSTFIAAGAISVSAESHRLVDPEATGETKALYINLSRLAKEKILFGHQNTTFSGVGWRKDPGRSDVMAACGRLPALYGWDVNNLGKYKSGDGKDLLTVRICEAFERGGVNTISWHMRNPVTGKNFYDTTPAVASILPRGEKHEAYKRELDRLAAFIRNLKNKNGIRAPIIFRPFHEHTGKWFWWGKGNCSPDEYAELWRFTVKYLRDEKNLHNLLYSYSPAKNREGREEDYLWGYPGDAFVDILGYDHYCQDVTEALPGLRLLVRLARERGKLAAFTETGVPKGMSQAQPGDYYTDRLLKPLKGDSLARQIAYIQLWQNTSRDKYWVPYEGHKLLPDFKAFASDPFMLFQDTLPDVYTPPGSKSH